MSGRIVTKPAVNWKGRRRAEKTQTAARGAAGLSPAPSVHTIQAQNREDGILLWVGDPCHWLGIVRWFCCWVCLIPCAQRTECHDCFVCVRLNSSALN